MRSARKKFPVAGAPARERERKSGKKERTDEFGDGFAASEGESHGDLSSPASGPSGSVPPGYNTRHKGRQE